MYRFHMAVKFSAIHGNSLFIDLIYYDGTSMNLRAVKAHLLFWGQVFIQRRHISRLNFTCFPVLIQYDREKDMEYSINSSLSYLQN
jgi:hypothetical protein